MRGAITDVIDARAKDDGGLTRLFGYSLAVHLVVFVGAVLIPSNWLSSDPVKPNVIEVSLGGSFGEKTTGVAPIAGRPVEKGVQEPPRPEPVKPVPPPKPDVMPTPSTTVSRPTVPEKMPEKVAPPSVTPPKPPVTGKQVQAGTAVTDTGATGTGQGLTQAGGGGTGGVVDLNTFDPVWTSQMNDAIRKQWNNFQQETGWSEVLFMVTRDGKVVSREIAATSGSFILDQEARRAVGLAMIPPLPRDYKEATLRVRLRFNYEVK